MNDELHMEILIYSKALLKPFIAIKQLVFTSKGLSISLPSIAAVGLLSTETKAWYFLLIVYAFDFITGIAASYHINFQIEKKKKYYIKIENSNLLVKSLFKFEFFIKNISSQKLRKSFIKAVGYSLFILLFYAVQNIFQIKTWKFDSISSLQWNLTLVAQASCIATEIWSILFENLKTLGFDIIASITNVSKTYREVKKEIQE